MTRLNAKTFMLTGLMFISSTGIARAEVNEHAVVRDSEGQVVHSTDGNCVRTQWPADQDVCAPQRVAQRTASEYPVQQRRETRAASLTQEDRTVYFAFDRSVLSPESKERLNTLVNIIKSDDSVKEARIVGYADRIGSVAYNEKLSQKRAQTIRDYLVVNGYTDARVTETRWVGKSEPSTNCPATDARSKLIECLHNDRRVEVEIGYLPEQQSAR